MRKRVLALVVVSALGMGGAQAATSPFNPEIDAARTAACVATYMTLSEASLKIESPTKSEELQAETGRGMERIKPFVEEATRVIGEKKFYHDGVVSRETDHRMLMTTPAGEATTAVADRLSAAAKDCDHQLDKWNAPQLCFAGSRWQACTSTSTSPGS